MQNQTDTIASTVLGKKVKGSETYNPSLLVAVPRQENRQKYNIDSNNLPFLGQDIWHAYEFSVMTANGIPVTRVIKLNYDCKNHYLIESKSLKLYLNSFNMSKFGQNIQQCLCICKTKIENDLSNKLQTEVKIEFLDNNSTKFDIFTVVSKVWFVFHTPLKNAYIILTVKKADCQYKVMHTAVISYY